MFVGQPTLVGPLYAEDSSGNPLTGLSFTGGTNFFTALNNGAWSTPAGTMVEVGGLGNGRGYYWYQPAGSDAATTGTLLILINGQCQQFSWKEDVVVDYLDARLSSILAVAGAVPVTSPFAPCYGIVMGDLEPALPINVTANGGAVNLTGSTSQQLRWKRPDGSVVTVALTAVSLVAGQLERVWGAGDTALVGTHQGQVVITNADSTTTTYPQDGSYYTWNIYPQLTAGMSA